MLDMRGECHPVIPGAMDNGGGVALTWRALEILKELSLVPRRTIRTVLLTGEEVGKFGSRAYFETHKENASLYQFIMESDIGTFSPLGLTSSIKNEQVRSHTLARTFAPPPLEFVIT